MQFRKLSETDREFVFAMLREAALWLREKNIDYWQNWFDPTEGQAKWIMDGLVNGQFFRVELDGETAGMVRIQYEDEKFWGKMDDKCVYIHSFTVKRELAGRGLGYRILSEIEQDHKKNGYRIMRLDCGSHLEKLISWYTGYGFLKIREGEVYGYRLVFLEKRIY
ncbi:MAG: GNAT family N-acetyltransferase [Spirochaetales bacterium]|nr:GNAT family N-acetyltransferase [Spirochaetales bacterium]